MSHFGLDCAEILRKNDYMVLVVKAVQIGLVWLTAVSTLIASVPHFDVSARTVATSRSAWVLPPRAPAAVAAVPVARPLPMEILLPG